MKVTAKYFDIVIVFDIVNTGITTDNYSYFSFIFNPPVIYFDYQIF